METTAPIIPQERRAVARLTPHLDIRLSKAAEKLGISRSDLIRLSLKKGLAAIESGTLFETLTPHENASSEPEPAETKAITGKASQGSLLLPQAPIHANHAPSLSILTPKRPKSTASSSLYRTSTPRPSGPLSNELIPSGI